MISCRSQRFLLTSLSRFQNVRLNLLWQRSFSNRSQRVTQTSRIPKYLALLGFGGASFYLYDRFRNSSEVVDTQLGHTEASVNLDLNEIYEKTAVVFLSNAEVREILGMPIKITSNNSISDTVRSIDLRREGSDLYAFIAYFVQGSQNSGVVYCKLKMVKIPPKNKIIVK